MKRIIAILVASSLSMTVHGFSSLWNSQNYAKNSLQREAQDLISKSMAHELSPSTRKTSSKACATDTARSAVVAFVASTLTPGWYLSPLPAVAQDWNAPIAIESSSSTQGASSSLLLARTSPSSVISSIETASLVIGDANEESTMTDCPEIVPVMESTIVKDTTSGSINLEKNQKEAKMLAGSARERAKEDPPGETYLLVENSQNDATPMDQEEAKVLTRSARERAREDPPGETYLLVQAPEETTINQEEAKILAGSARERAKEDPPGETYLLVENSQNDATPMDQEEAKILAGSARERAKEDPPGETYLLVQAQEETTVKNAENVAGSARERTKEDPPGETYLLVQGSTEEEVLEEASELAMEVELTQEASIEEQTLVATAPDATPTEASVAEESAASNKLLADATTIKEPQQEQSLRASKPNELSQVEELTLVADASSSKEVHDTPNSEQSTLIANAPTKETEDEGSSTLIASVEEPQVGEDSSSRSEESPLATEANDATADVVAEA